MNQTNVVLISTIIEVGKKELHSKSSAVLLSTVPCNPKTTTEFWAGKHLFNDLLDA